MSKPGRVLQSVIRDCLFVNWARPVDEMPQLPRLLRYDVQRAAGRDYAFISARLFRHQHLQVVGVPILRVSYPQFHLRLHVIDHEGLPAVLFRHVLVPAWVVPSARWLAHQPASAAALGFPRPSDEPERGEWVWQVVRPRKLRLTGRLGAPRAGGVPDLGSWERTVRFLGHRDRGYVNFAGELRPVATSTRTAPIWPMQVELEEPELLSGYFEGVEVSSWADIHSAWLCPEIALTYQLSAEPLPSVLARSRPPIAADPAMLVGSSSRVRRSAA